MKAELEEKRPSTSDPDDSDGESSASFSLSLCDFPLAGHGRSDCPSSCGDRQLSHPPPTGPLEFLSGDLSAAEEMCSTEDVFLQGKLLPYKPPSPHRYPKTSSSRGSSSPISPLRVPLYLPFLNATVVKHVCHTLSEPRAMMLGIFLLFPDLDAFLSQLNLCPF